MKDSNPYQIIVGPASTGKTILIQLKAYQILQKDVSAAVLIVLPLDILKVKYIQFFKHCGLVAINNLFIKTIKDDWKTVMINHNPHVFIDEFSAVQSMAEHVLSQVLTLAKTNVYINRMIWLSIDFLQNFDIVTLGLPQVQDKTFIEKASRKHLLMVHRCTRIIFQVA